MRLRKHFAIAVAVIALAGCAEGPSPAAPEPQSAPAATTPPITRQFQCEKFALTATFQDDHVELQLPERRLILPHAISASGARYTDGAALFWDKGGQATLELDGVQQMCQVVRNPWEEARERGVQFRAIGQEPGWDLEIDKSELRLRYDYGERKLQAPLPAPVNDGTTVRYETAVDSHNIRVVIERRECADVMSGEKFSHTVAVTVDDRMLHGCGREISKE
ncbi:MAG TPA: MliC family protein [Terriglobia bacterium]|nr:MliC family protein [Terriglobia bacterium]